MKNLLILIAFTLTIVSGHIIIHSMNDNSAVQDCLEAKCPNEVKSCTDIFSCAPKAIKCQSKCKEDELCLLDCASSSGSSKLVAVYVNNFNLSGTCGKANCLTTPV